MKFDLVKKEDLVEITRKRQELVDEMDFRI